MHGSSSRDDRQKREQRRQEKELAKFVQMHTLISLPCADARKQQQQLQQQQEESAPVSTELNSATTLADEDQRKALKFGFSSKGGATKSKVRVLIVTVHVKDEFDLRGRSRLVVLQRSRKSPWPKYLAMKAMKNSATVPAISSVPYKASVASLCNLCGLRHQLYAIVLHEM
ncbi:hypothetical protein C1H46_007946 [Malus baccata]|uniref:Uncharacterized protein n=1 Tax=Malus baccata TaxID=106549 RepID=A0A540N5W5_MALBA|nr:hypothetical protein C1H46_007946 [Malus baccata]